MVTDLSVLGFEETEWHY